MSGKKRRNIWDFVVFIVIRENRFFLKDEYLYFRILIGIIMGLSVLESFQRATFLDVNYPIKYLLKRY